MDSLYLILLITITLAKFEEKNTVSINKQLNNHPNSTKAKLLNISVILIAIAIMIYVYIEYIVSYWFSPYLQEAKHIKVTDSVLSLAYFGELFLFHA